MSVLQSRPDHQADDDAPARPLPANDDDAIERVVEFAPATAVSCSVVVVTYGTDREDVRALLAALDRQTTDDFEVLVVDNGTDWPVVNVAGQYDSVRTYAEAVENLGVTRGRNVGARLATADVVTFLDDDAVPAPDFVASHLREHRENDLFAVRGRVHPATDCVYNRLQSHYDLGDEPAPYYLNIEGNCSVDREAFLELGGFSERLTGRAGHEGIELTYRAVRAGYDREAIRYSPDPVIYHDNAVSFGQYLHKRRYRRRYATDIRDLHPDVFDFTRSYETPGSEREDDATGGLSDRVHELAVLGVVKVVLTLRD
ncbi:glycosyltransferase family 2 protein [Halomarina litorea]|uniref:glycosyltransferase family 2 protein n=1 Tax=Halomarina litorea TaxID=2961595 RepID=UPI0020C27806|nr:glycosyltransferase family 2 protein [Halomarina sp. BCD28]